MTASQTRGRPKAAKIDKMMEEASQALANTDYFECERRASQALELAHTAADYERMARIILPLEEARRQRRLAAIDTGELRVVNDYTDLEPLLEGTEPPPSGCYLIECPLVGADGRNLRERCYANRVDALVIVREPETQLGMWPLVMIGPVTVRAYVRPPGDADPDTDWLVMASEALGDAAIQSVDTGADIFVQVHQLYDRLCTVIDHDRLHQALLGACEEAARASAEASR